MFIDIKSISESAIHLVGKDILKCDKEIHSCICFDEREYSFVCSTNIEGLFQFGIKPVVLTLNSTKNKIYPSRASVMNKLFDTMLIDATYEDIAGNISTCGINLYKLQEIIKGTSYMIDWIPTIDEWDVEYHIIKRNGGEIVYGNLC